MPDKEHILLPAEHTQFITAKLDNLMLSAHTLSLQDELFTHARDFQALHSDSHQALGAWVYTFISHLITLLPRFLRNTPDPDFDFLTLINDIPVREESLQHKLIIEMIPPRFASPHTRDQFFHTLQLCSVLTELNCEQAGIYLAELNPILEHQPDTLFSLYAGLLFARVHHITGLYAAEQERWLTLVISAVKNLGADSAVYFLLQWIISLKWLKPARQKKELLLALNNVYAEGHPFNKALLLYELFRLPERSNTVNERISYVNQLRSMPVTLFTVEQLQEVYYFGGNIKSAMDSIFLESVSDYQCSNYYTYKRWERIRHINRFLRHNLLPQDYIAVQERVEDKVVELINQMNFQSNVFVETLQANFQKIEGLYHQVEELSLTDTLTGLHNRRYLQNNTNEIFLLAARRKSALSITLFDIDDFKLVNDRWGHACGDYILSELAGILTRFFRRSDFIIRYGGEEFLIILFDTDVYESELLMNGLRESIAQYRFFHDGHDLKVTISLGTAVANMNSHSAEPDLQKLICAADNAMYESKHKGKNCLTIQSVAL